MLKTEWNSDNFSCFEIQASAIHSFFVSPIFSNEMAKNEPISTENLENRFFKIPLIFTLQPLIRSSNKWEFESMFRIIISIERYRLSWYVAIDCIPCCFFYFFFFIFLFFFAPFLSLSLALPHKARKYSPRLNIFAPHCSNTGFHSFAAQMCTVYLFIMLLLLLLLLLRLNITRMKKAKKKCFNFVYRKLICAHFARLKMHAHK